MEHRIHQYFDWENIKILDEEKILNKRLILEAIHVKQQKQSLNLQNDIVFFRPTIYEFVTEL